MSPARRYITYLVVKQPDGSRCECELTLTPIGSSSTAPGLFWTHLLNSLVRDELTAGTLEELDSLQSGPLDAPVN